MNEFISFQDGILKTICKVYQHEDGRMLYLLPVTHIGERRYYEKLLEYIGEKICVYEGINIKLKDNENAKLPTTPQSFDEWLQYNEKLANKMDAQAGSEIKRFQKKIIRRDVRHFRSLVKRNLGLVDDRITTFFYQLERTNFGFHNLTIQQNLLAEFLDLSFQYNVIDYVSDISNRKNWIHGDLEVQLSEQSIDQAKETLKHPPLTFVQLTKTNARQFYAMLYLIESLIHENISERRRQLANIFATIKQEDIPLELIDGRNNIIIETSDDLFDDHDDVVIFYGVAHMDGIKLAAEKGDFKLISTKEFEVYRLSEEPNS